MIVTVLLMFISLAHLGECYTTEDLELFDLVESTPQTFYAVLGVDEKASSSEIRKAYRRLSTLYHPDKSTEPDAETKFRQIAAVADVLRNDERRKTYDLVLKTGLPDWRTPIYYYRQLRNMGILEISIFLFGLATLGQYLFAWSSYWEKKYEIEEVVLSKFRRKAKNQRKGKYSKEEEEAIVSEYMATLQKPSYQDLFPVRLFYFMIHVIKSSPSYIATCGQLLKQHKEEVSESESDEEEETQAPRIRIRKHVKPDIPDYTGDSTYNSTANETSASNGDLRGENSSNMAKWCVESLTEQQVYEFKKALKKFPNGTLQRWEKVAAHLGCSVNDVVSMVKKMKNQQFTNGIPIAMQGVTGVEKENMGCDLYEEKDKSSHAEKGSVGKLNNNLDCSSQPNNTEASVSGSIGKFWKQEEQQNLERALQKFPKDTPARWDRIAEFVSSKSKEECLERCKILVQQVKKKKDHSS